ncbi:histidine phosphatase family protein [Crenalkalicoccus roseus]|uniref:histidine phosphatase family protein n=1 Tax=Crenalkalicoccus roseus TaxID=1485588 RepID=UPI001080F59D|nr:histidine phosphatase family protein [Crenalkalicoccus roseus]
MATVVFLVRHAAHGLVRSVLCGRMEGVHLSEEGRLQAAALARRLARECPDALCTGPLPRARETAEAIARATGLVPVVEAALDEMDFGTWSGQSFVALEADPEWRLWNEARASSRPPGGESMAEAQRRILSWLEARRKRQPEGRVVAVTHAEVIKAALAGVLGLSLDAHARFDIAPAGLSAIALWEGGGKVLWMNEVAPT